MDRSQIRQAVRDWLNEATAGLWSDARLNRAVDNANQKVNSVISALDEDFFTVSATFSTTQNLKSYELPSDFRAMIRLEHYSATDPNDIEKIDELKFPRTESQSEWPFNKTGKPKRYILRGDQIDLYPIPDGVYTLRIYYDKRMANLALETDVPASPLDFHDLIAREAYIDVLEDNDDEPTQTFMDRTVERRKELISSIVSRKGDDPEAVEGYLEGVH